VTHTGYDHHAELAGLYDALPLYNARRDVEFYVELCRRAGRESGDVLELGCGTGRVLIPAAEAGARMTGLDNSKGMLARCRAKASALPVTLVEADMTRFALGRTFRLAIIPFRPLQHLIAVEEQLRCLECVREHLEPGGRLVFDVFHPNLAMLVAPASDAEFEDTPEVRLPDGRTLRRAFRLTGKHRAEQVNDAELIYYLDGQRIVQVFPMRYFFRYEVEHLLARAGFEVAALHGNFDKSAFGDDSPEMIFTAVRS